MTKSWLSGNMLANLIASKLKTPKFHTVLTPILEGYTNYVLP